MCCTLFHQKTNIMYYVQIQNVADMVELVRFKGAITGHPLQKANTTIIT